MKYKKDTLIGTWVAITIILGAGCGVYMHFNLLTSPSEPTFLKGK